MPDQKNEYNTFLGARIYFNLCMLKSIPKFLSTFSNSQRKTTISAVCVYNAIKKISKVFFGHLFGNC